MNELETHRDALKQELEQLEATLAHQARSLGGDEARALRAELAHLEEEVRELTEVSERLDGRIVELDMELEPLREETRRAVAYLADLETPKGW